ncbi:hypothetical protein DZC30_22420 [Comamonas testosteroni]|uniref:Uncharacterized protein n=1 Tax=Comamonas testosteroni TaxID=285 RepID=A0A373F4I4_COMTE|nr:hypothetical protein DZC30_22420 [Comamonas testosteroni]
MIKKLEEHRDTIKLVVEIAKLYEIPVTPSVNNDCRGDFEYPQDRKIELISALDKYLGKYKYTKDANGK